MNAAGRSYRTAGATLTAGVALAAASVIAVNPLAPPVPDVKVVSAPVQLTARPFDAYFEVFEPLVGAPILEQVAANVELLGAALADGDPGIDLIRQFILQPLYNVSEVLGTAIGQLPLLAGAAVFVVVANTGNESGRIYQDLSDAATAEDWLEVAHVIAEAPARLAKAVLWGSGVTGGLLSWPQDLRERIAQALAPDTLQAFRGGIAETLAPEYAPSTITRISDPERAALDTVDIAQHADPPDISMPPEGNDTSKTFPADEPAENTGAAPMSAIGGPGAATEEDGLREKDYEKTSETVQVPDSAKVEAGRGGKSPRKSDSPKPFKKIRDAAARSAADGLNGKRAESPSSTRSSRDNSASGASSGSDHGSSKDAE